MTLEIYKPTIDEFEDHRERIKPVPRGESVKYSLSRVDPVYFIVNQLGIKPYTWQAKFLDGVAAGDNMAVCSARQIGKTFSIAAYCLWACVHNTMPLETTKKTRIVIVSATEEQSKKIIGDIKELIMIGDDHVWDITSKEKKDAKTGKVVKIGGVENHFSNKIDKHKDASNSKSAITFTNGCQIISLPPTERARGYTGSILFIDEAAFIAEEEIYESTLKNIVAKTGNRICLTSTPNGKQGFFFHVFDPDDELPHHTFERIWLPYTSLELDDPALVSTRRREEDIATALGKEREFQQEHMASFNSATHSFFDSDDVDKGVRKTLVMLEDFRGQCDLAVDFGKTVSRTVITISTLEGTGDDSRIRLLYQYEYPAQQDLSLMDDIQGLLKRFGIQRVIFEDCPASEHARQEAEKRGWNLVMFNPSRDKARKYTMFRSWLRQGRIVFPEVHELIKQMKGMIQEETPRTTKIYHGAGLLDDRVDSFMMSTIMYTDDKPRFRFFNDTDFFRK